MIWIRDEGEAIHNGINFYPLSNRFCRGFVARLGRRMFWCRYSAAQGRMIVRFTNQ